MYRKLLLTTLLIAPLTALAESYSPAGFIGGEKSLGELIEFPELRGDATIVISCIGLMTTKGRLDEHGCYVRNPGDEAFIQSIYKVIKKARFRPAKIDGRAVSVVFQYRVQFKQEGDAKTLQFVANPGFEENVEAYGQGHVAAQREYTKETWEKACPRHAKFQIMAAANVNFDGTPGSASVKAHKGVGISPACEQAIIDNLLSSRFIPAMVDGESVPSTYAEPFGN